MTRVEWTRYSGEDIEAVVAMFISAIFPAAERVTPSQGDGGIDVLVKTDLTRVYQVKRFSGSLTSSQEAQIKKSVDRLVEDPRVADLTVDEWHLVMPWDPTLEAKKWVTEYVTVRGLPEPIWDGLTQCDLWASSYPNIVDYYLHGNADRIRDTAIAIVRGARLKEIDIEDIEKFDIANFTKEIEATVNFLNHEDPFYVYGIHIEPHATRPQEDIRVTLQKIRPGVVLSSTWGNDLVSVQIDVYAKNRVAFELMPIFGKLTFTAEPNSPEAEALKNFAKFGSPFHLPEGSAQGSLIAPGGLGGPIENAAVTLLPNPQEDQSPHDLRLVLHDVNGKQTDSLIVHRRHATSGISSELGPAGVESSLVDDSGVLEFLLRFDVETQKQSIEVSAQQPYGRLAVDVLPALQFLHHVQSPYTLTVAPRFGPIPTRRDALPEGPAEPSTPHLWYDIARSISLIQDFTSTPLHFPDLSSMEEVMIQQVLQTGALLDGQTASIATSQVATEHNPEAGKEVQDGQENTLTVLSDWEINLTEDTVQLGKLAYGFTGSINQRGVPGPEGRLVDVWSVSDNQIIVRALTDEERQALPTPG